MNNKSSILCIGAGTGSELIYLAKCFPNYHFTALDPSKAMLDICKQQVKNAGFLDRCDFHNGYLETLPEKLYDGITSILVSQFILDQKSRHDFFSLIHKKLNPKGILINADISADTSSNNYKDLLTLWVKLFNNNTASNEQIHSLNEAYNKSVSILPPSKVQEIIEQSGFSEVSLFFQSLLMHAWVAKRS